MKDNKKVLVNIICLQYVNLRETLERCDYKISKKVKEKMYCT